MNLPQVYTCSPYKFFDALHSFFPTFNHDQSVSISLFGFSFKFPQAEERAFSVCLSLSDLFQLNIMTSWSIHISHMARISLSIHPSMDT